MSRPQRDQELRVRGLPLAARFTLTTSVALALVMGAAGFLLVSTSTTITQRAQEQALADSIALTARELRPANFEQVGQTARETLNPRVRRFDIVYGIEAGKRTPAILFEAKTTETDSPSRLMVSADRGATGSGLVGLIAGITMAVIVAGALVAFFAATRVSRPLEGIVNDIRQIARGQLHHRSRVRGAAEVELLGRAINRMAEGLEEAQEAQIELGVREREMEVADEVRDALRPDAPPEREGYDVAVLHVGSPQPGGDFHDFIELADGRVGMLVCSVSGQGVPGALIGATARAYLRSELAHGTDVAAALRKVNAALSRDVRRGMYVTAMYVLLDPRDGSAQIACAGHKLPLLRFCCGDGKMRTLQPEGIALGFDKGPVFNSRLQVERLTLEVGDRLVLANTGPVAVTDPDENELGEAAFYRMVLKHSKLSSHEMLASLEQDLLDYADETPLPSDISIVTVSRTA